METPIDARFVVILRPVVELPGQWVGHCLDLDVVSQGRSPSHALEMTVEACTMVLMEDRKRGLDPARRRAPIEFWQEFGVLVGRARALAPHSDPRMMDGLTDHIEAIVASVSFRPMEGTDTPAVDICAAWASGDAAPSQHH